MPGKARERSSTELYHVMLRGINGQIMFGKDEDYQCLKTVIAENTEFCGYV